MSFDLGVQLSDYQMGVEGAGQMTQADLNELQKALSAGEITGRETTGLTTASGAPLKVESLENTLKVLTFKESDINLWKKIPKLPAYNTVEEYNELQSYGAENFSFNNEGELPEEDDSIYVRRAQLVKFMGTTRVISHPMQLVNTMIGDVVQQEIKNGTLKILRDVDKAIVFADQTMIPQQFNGLYAQHVQSFSSLALWGNNETVIDLKGFRLNESVIEQAALTVIENHGEGSLLAAPPKVLSNFVKEFHDFKMIQPNTPALINATMGQRVDKFMSQFGTIDLLYDKFMKSGTAKTLASSATSTKAPNAPIADPAAPKAAVADAAGSKFVTGDNGDYRYAVSAVNRYGESALTNLSTAGLPNAEVTVAVGESVTLTFTSGGGAVPATAYIIYRSVKDDVATTAAGTTFYPIFMVSVAQLGVGYDGGGPATVRDRNRIIANTESAFLIDPANDVWSFKQLAPLMKMDLAVLGPATRFMILLYGTPMLYAPRKIVRFVNIGITATP